ncbi:MAG: glycosyl hydrolase [Acidobacteriota bacterium]
MAQIEHTFKTPPNDARVMVRWWWFGPAVVKPELLKELEQMKQGGFGGYEIQPVYPLALDDPQTGFRNLPYLSPEFLDDVGYVNREGDKLGLRANLTLASGWPYGGPHTPVTDAAAMIRELRAPLQPGQNSAPVPAIGNGEQLLAVFAGPADAAPSALRQLPLPAAGALRIDTSHLPAGSVLRWYVMTRTGQQVKRAAVDAEGFVLDHFSAEAVQKHLHDVADKLISAFGNQPPYSVFSDSLEVFEADWTPHLLAEFRSRRGYDLLPHLPELFSANPDAEALSVRHDWGLTLTELVDQNYLTPINQWAREHRTRFRSQTYGSPAVSLSSNALVDLPEGEGPQWQQFSFTRWATSASHVYGRPITSSETWTWLHSPAFRATPLDMKAEADRFFLQGINQLMAHGWAYSPPSVPEPGWSFYAAGVFNAHNPWWIVMPDVTSYFQRVSWILRQGQPANNVAIYLPEDDAYAAFTPGKVALTSVMPRWITPQLTQAVENAGYNFDYIDAKAIAARGIHYPVLIMPNVNRIAPATLAQIAAYVHNGGRVIAVGRIPAHAPGLENFAAVSQRVQAAAKSLFASDRSKLVSSAEDLPAALHAAVPQQFQLTPAAPEVGFIRRKLPEGEIYFIANTSNQPIKATMKLHTRYLAGEWLDPDSGATSPLHGSPLSCELDLPPYGSRILLLHTGAASPAAPPAGQETNLADLSSNWSVSFPGAAAPETMAHLSSWTDSQKTEFFSGVAVYRRAFTLPSAPAAGTSILLDFGQGTPTPEPPASREHPGMHALYDPPIREAAVVYVNGQRAGSLWHPPYRLDITHLLQPGKNTLEVRVANTAINELAGESRPDYRLLWARYGRRAVPQDMNHLAPVPSGLLGHITLVQQSAP